jgi:hypothetical protein
VGWLVAVAVSLIWSLHGMKLGQIMPPARERSGRPASNQRDRIPKSRDCQSGL